MPTPEQEQAARQQLRESLKVLLAFRNEDLVRTDDLGKQMDFSEGRDAVDRLLRLYEDLAGSPLDVLPHEHLTRAKAYADQAAQFLKQIQTFRAEQGSGARQGLINQVWNAYDEHLNYLALPVAYAYAKGTDLRTLERQVRETADNLRKEAEQASKDARQRVQEVENVLQTVREAAAQVGVAHHATNFDQEANSHEQSAKDWMKALLALSVVGAAMLFILFIRPFGVDPATLTPGHAIYAVATRVLVFSVVSYVLLWTARNYMAHRHNTIVNRHRQNALTTFETFVKAGGDDRDIKNAVLLQASQCIFTAQATGYLSREPVPSPPRDLVGVVQRALSPAKDDHS